LKNWLVAFLAAILFGATLTQHPIWYHIAALIMILAFFLLEVLQQQFESALSLRARAIEAGLRRSGSPVFEPRRRIKYRTVKKLNEFAPDSPSHAIYLRFLHLRRFPLNFLVLRAHGFFYFASCIIVIGSGVFNSKQTDDSIRKEPVDVISQIGSKLSNQKSVASEVIFSKPSHLVAPDDENVDTSKDHENVADEGSPNR